MATSIGDLVVYVSADTSGYVKNMAKVESTAEQAADTVSDANQEIGDTAEDAANNSQSAWKKLTSTLSSVAKTASGTVVGAFKNVTSAVAGTTSGLDALKSYPKVMSNLGYSFDEIKQSVDSLEKAVKNVPTSFNDVANLTTRLSAVTSSLDEATDTAISFNNALVAGGKDAKTQAAAMDALVNVISTGKVDLQSWENILAACGMQMDQLAKSMLGASADAYDLASALDKGEASTKDFTSALSKLNSEGATGVQSFQDQAAASTTVTTSYKKQGVVMGAVAGIASTVVARAFNMVVDSVGDAAARLDTLNNYPKVMENLGYSAEDAEASISTLSDSLTGLPTSLDEMATVVQRIAPVSSSLAEATDVAVAFNDMLVAGATDASTQANAMEQLVQILSTGKVEMDGWKSIMTAVPGQMQQVATAMLGAGASTSDLYSALQSGTLSMQDFTAAVVQLDQEGAAGITAFSQQAQDASGGIQTSWSNVQTAITRGLANVLDSLNGDGNIGNVMGSIATVFESALSIVADAIEWASPLISEIANALSWFSDHGEATKAILLGLGGAFATLKVVTSIGDALNSFKTAMSGYSTVAGVANKATALFNTTLLANPFVLVAALIAIVVAALIWFFTQTETGRQMWDSFTEFLGNAWDWICEKAAVVWEWISENILAPIRSAIEWLVEKWNAYYDTAVTVWTWIYEKAIEIWGWISENIISPIRSAIEWLVEKWGEYGDTVIKVWTWIYEKAVEIWGWIYDNIIVPVKKIYNYVVPKFNELKEKVSKAWDDVKEKIRKVKDWITDFFKNPTEWLKNAGKDLIKGLWNGISSVKDWILGKIGGWVDDILGGIKSFFGIASPSTLFRDEVGKWIPAGIGVGVEVAADSALNPLEALAGQMATVGVDASGLEAEYSRALTVRAGDVAASLTVQDGGGESLKGQLVEAFREALLQVPNVRTFESPGEAAVWLGKAMNSQLETLSKRGKVFA